MMKKQQAGDEDGDSGRGTAGRRPGQGRWSRNSGWETGAGMVVQELQVGDEGGGGDDDQGTTAGGQGRRTEDGGRGTASREHGQGTVVEALWVGDGERDGGRGTVGGRWAQGRWSRNCGWETGMGMVVAE